MRTKLFSLVSLLLAASVILAACGQATPVVQTVIVGGEVQVVTATPGPAPEGPKTLTFLGNLAGDIPTIDPALTTDTSSVQIVDETSVGLTRQNEVTTAVEPGMATTWDVVDNADGTQTVTFHLRNDVPWVKWDAASSSVIQVMDCQETPAPRMVNANDFVYGIDRTLAPATASSYAYVLAFAIKGASDYNAGTNEDAASVAVKAIDDWTLEITFLEQATYNVNIAGMWVAHAQPAWIIDGDDCTEANGNRWTETGFFQGYGPYTLQRMGAQYRDRPDQEPVLARQRRHPAGQDRCAARADAGRDPGLRRVRSRQHGQHHRPVGRPRPHQDRPGALAGTDHRSGPVHVLLRLQHPGAVRG